MVVVLEFERDMADSGKVFYEQAGEGEQDIVFLHTAGSDSRQYHGVLNNEQMRKRVRSFRTTSKVQDLTAAVPHDGL